MNENSFQNRVQEHKLISRLNELGAEYAQVLKELAHKESEYYAIKTTTILTLKAQGESATNIANLIKGIPAVNEKMLAFKIAEANVKAKQEQINILKLQLRMAMD